MKFLCLDCDEPMKLHSTEGPDEGSLSVTFRCPECGFRVAMLTNPFETQMVRSLGVKVGGATPPAPFEHVRTMMANPRADAFEGDVAKSGAGQADAGTEAGGCPFAAMVNERREGAHCLLSSASPATVADSPTSSVWTTTGIRAPSGTSATRRSTRCSASSTAMRPSTRP